MLITYILFHPFKSFSFLSFYKYSFKRYPRTRPSIFVKAFESRDFLTLKKHSVSNNILSADLPSYDTNCLKTLETKIRTLIILRTCTYVRRYVRTRRDRHVSSLLSFPTPRNRCCVFLHVVVGHLGRATKSPSRPILVFA